MSRFHRSLTGIVTIVTSVTFATVVAVGMLVAASAYFAATMGTPRQWSGALASGVAVGLSGIYVGTMARRRHRDRLR